MKEIRKILRVVGIIFWGVCDIMLAYVVVFFLSLLLFICNAETVYNALSSSLCGYVYGVVATLGVLRNAYHRSKWYVCTHPIKTLCCRCHNLVSITRYGEERYLNSPISFFVIPLSKQFNFTLYKVLFYKIAYRPYLLLDCPECGEKQVICPYCHEPIPQESVVCKYDKPSRCPHCGKKIYTPVPIQDWDDAIIVGDIID